MSLQLLLDILIVPFFITALTGMVVIIVPIPLAMAYFQLRSVFAQEMGIAPLQTTANVMVNMSEQNVKLLCVLE